MCFKLPSFRFSSAEKKYLFVLNVFCTSYRSLTAPFWLSHYGASFFFKPAVIHFLSIYSTRCIFELPFIVILFFFLCLSESDKPKCRFSLNGSFPTRSLACSWCRCPGSTHPPPPNSELRAVNRLSTGWISRSAPSETKPINVCLTPY